MNAGTREDATLWIFPAYSEQAQGQESSYSFTFRDVQMGYFTGLSVSHEPGQWAVWAGVVLMTLGLGVAFYMVHMRVWAAAIENAQGELVLWVGGAANKNRDRFEQKFDELVQILREQLGTASAAKKEPARKEESELTLTAAN